MLTHELRDWNQLGRDEYGSCGGPADVRDSCTKISSAKNGL